MAEYEKNVSFVNIIVIQNFEEAAKYFERVLAQDNKMADVHFNVANAYFKMRKTEKSIRHYKIAINIIKPNVPLEYFLNIANAF